MRLRNKSTKRRNNEAKFKNQSMAFKPKNFKSLKNHQLITNSFPINLVKSHYEFTGLLVRLSHGKGLKKQKNSKH